MKRILLPFVAIALVGGIACGSGVRKAGSTKAPEQPATTSPPTATKTAKPTAAAATAHDTGGDGGAATGDPFDGILGTVFGSALSGGPGAGLGLGEGDPALKAYLPEDSEMPDGYASLGDFTFRAPDTISANGSMDVAAKMAFSGDISSGDPTGAGILMVLVIKPEDLEALGESFDAFSNLDEEALRDALGASAGGGLGVELKSVKVLDAGGLGDGGAGMEMTIELGGAIGGLSRLGVGEDAEGADIGQLRVMTMRVYVFARGDYAGAVMRIAFSDELPDDVDDLALAKIVDEKLKAAP